MNELVISKSDEGLRIALLKEKLLVELHHESVSEEFAVGDLILGRVRKIVPGLNAAFVDVGHPKDAFLHYFDLGPQLQTMLRYLKIARSGRQEQPLKMQQVSPMPDINKMGKMEEVLKSGQEVLVQVVKEPISTKGPRLSSEISLPGQFVVLVPFANVVSVSKKVRSNEERKRLRMVAESLKPENCGVIVRTAAEGRDYQAIADDIQDILTRWDELGLALRKAQPPAKVLSEQTRAASILRDMLSQGFDAIHVDDLPTYNGVKQYLEEYQPEHVKALRLYKGKSPLFHASGIERQIKSSFGKVVSLVNGAYLVIEHTEAMHVIDVNSGSKNLGNDSLEETAVQTNKAAAEEIARQLRLRDLGGIIVVDFIDMKRNENRRIVNDYFRDAMKLDRARHTILPISRFGLVQITRQRVRPQLEISTSELCPSCKGSGKIQASIAIVDEIANNMEFLMRQNKEKRMRIAANPYVTAYLTKGLFKSYQWKWLFKYGVWIKVQEDISLPFSSVRYYNSTGEEIKLA